MKTFKIFNVLVVTGKPEELADVDALAMGTHHIQKYPTRKKKGKPEKGGGKCIACERWTKYDIANGTGLNGKCSLEGKNTLLYDTCENWRERGDGVCGECFHVTTNSEYDKDGEGYCPPSDLLVKLAERRNCFVAKEDKDSRDVAPEKEGDSGQVAGGEQPDPGPAGEAVGEKVEA
jgi:hypothetical protein